MKQYLPYLLLFIGLSGFAGGEVGNGARAVVIKELNGTAKEMELTDFWDAKHPSFIRGSLENQNRFEIMDTTLIQPFRGENVPVVASFIEADKLFSDRLTLLFKKLSNNKLAEDLKEGWKELRDFKVIINPRGNCQKLNDVERAYYPPVYDVIQAISTDIRTQKICIAEEFLRMKKSRPSMSAAMDHELFYFVGRTKYGHMSSDLSREMTAFVFSTEFAKENPETNEKFFNLVTRFVKNRPRFYIGWSENGLPDGGYDPRIVNKIIGENFPSFVPFTGEKRGTGGLNDAPELNDVGFDHEKAYASEIIQKDRWKRLKKVNPHDFSCDQNFEVHKREFKDRGVGDEIQLYVIPPLPNVEFGPGRRWFPSGYKLTEKDFLDIYNDRGKEIGPDPFAAVILTSTLYPSVKAEIPENVSISTDGTKILWSFGSLIGTCERE